jgi:pilus assembly protein Flp/PilA
LVVARLGSDINAAQTHGLIKISSTIFTDMDRAVGMFPRATTQQPRQQSGAEIMIQAFKRFGQDQSGATAIEYGLIAAGIAVAIIATVQALGTQLNTTFSSVSSAIK